jgi:hypothetical protein
MEQYLMKRGDQCRFCMRHSTRVLYALAIIEGSINHEPLMMPGYMQDRQGRP